MTTQQSDISRVFELFDNAEFQLAELISSFSEIELNIIPYENSWTVAQVAAHIAKANASVAESLSISTKTIDRKPDERVQELKKIFLDFTVKFQSQKAILPTAEVYRKEALLEELKTSFKELKAAANRANLYETFQHHVLGETSKLEMVYLIVYHTLRHIHQLEDINRIVKNR